MLELFHAPTSPYVRKVMVCAHLLGCVEQISLRESAAHPVQRDDRIASFNPLAKVPAARTDDGQLLYDSRVICEYLDHTQGGALFPRAGAARWQALTWQSLGDGLLDAALLARYERTARPPAQQWDGWVQAQYAKIDAALAAMSLAVPALRVDSPTIAEITFGCGLGYLDFRFAERPWRAHHPELAEWFARLDALPAMTATRPHV